MKTTITNTVLKENNRSFLTILDKLPAIISSVFSVIFALSIVLELSNIVQGFVLGFLVVFIVLFLLMNETIKVKMIKRLFNGNVKGSIIPFAITFMLSIALSSIGIWFWTNKTAEINSTSKLEQVTSISDVKQKYNVLLVDLHNNTFDQTEEYKSLNKDLAYWKSRRAGDIEERKELRVNVKNTQLKIDEQRTLFNKNIQSQIANTTKLMNDEISIIDVNFDNKTNDGERNSFISYIFLSLILITEFAIIILNKILVEKESHMNDFVTGDAAKKYMIERNILSNVFLTKKVGDEITINNIKYSTSAKGVVFGDIKMLYNILMNIGILSEAIDDKKILTNTLLVDENKAIEMFDTYYDKYFKLKIA